MMPYKILWGQPQPLPCVCKKHRNGDLTCSNELSETVLLLSVSNYDNGLLALVCHITSTGESSAPLTGTQIVD
jgi:hypothetical protein